MILLLAAPYLFFLTIIVLSQLSYTQAMEMTLGSIGYPYAAMLLLIFLPNMIYAFILPRRGYTPQQLLFWDMLLKLCNIPLYILVFIAGMLLAGTIIGLGLIPFFMLFDYLLLLPSTMYGVSGLRQAYKGRPAIQRRPGGQQHPAFLFLPGCPQRRDCFHHRQGENRMPPHTAKVRRMVSGAGST